MKSKSDIAELLVLVARHRIEIEKQTAMRARWFAAGYRLGKMDDPSGRRLEDSQKGRDLIAGVRRLFGDQAKDWDAYRNEIFEWMDREVIKEEQLAKFVKRIRVEP